MIPCTVATQRLYVLVSGTALQSYDSFTKGVSMHVLYIQYVYNSQ